MTENIRITCLLDRYWDSATLDYAGTEKSGVLIDISMQSAEEDPDKLIPIGIVVLDDNTFHSVPMEFIKKATAN
jgi:hypothetical protein